MYEVANNIPLPDKEEPLIVKIDSIAIGASMAFPKDKRGSVNTAARSLRTKKFTIRCRKEDEEGRIWRTL